ncbi:hypothetical protein NP233_g2586 [Leucocoprinus birnbaumii]|uniref:Blue (type 1) copper domain-containing protein n=1 Tax=Leucocoprinus birnbaumii TaxID=56174 RepID=A0AAD5VY17_9AGAR|nr:hypothetical protein NP233_g2586 [Leucocoprinus birnbaumii]
MLFFQSLLSLALAQLAVAQYGAPDPSQSSSAAGPAPSAPADTAGHHNIDVFPNGTYVFHPANITANVGDLVTFYFPNSGAISHSVTQSSFANPCTHLAANGSDPAGFDSSLLTSTTFTLNITSTNPIWFHCKQVLHCGMGMVGSINAPLTGNNTHANYVANAMAIGNNEVTETDTGTPVLTGVNAVPVGPPGSSDAMRVAAKGGLYFAVVAVLMSLI